MVPTPDADPLFLEAKGAEVCLCPLPRVKDKIWAVQLSSNPGVAKQQPPPLFTGTILSLHHLDDSDMA